MLMERLTMSLICNATQSDDLRRVSYVNQQTSKRVFINDSNKHQKFCFKVIMMANSFNQVPFERFNHHKDLYLKLMKAFMFKHEHLNYVTVCIYKIDSRFSKTEIDNILSTFGRPLGTILVLGVKKH